MAVHATGEPLDEQRRSVPVDRRIALARAIIAILRQAIGEPRIVEHHEAKAHMPGPLSFVSARLGLRQYVLVTEASI
jgi:hypothetical protein